MEETCEFCKYWDSEHLEMFESQNLGPDDLACVGQCRRYPPKRPQEVSLKEVVDGNGYFPLTCEWDWCGEFRSKQQQITN